MVVPWKRRSRLRRILTQIRRIRRSQPHLALEYRRENQDVYITLRNERDFLLFKLMWPQDLPQWRRV
jgi:hypothetical protein